MYIKVIHPKTQGVKAYHNQGSARQAANYLEQEAKRNGGTASFFTSDSVDLSAKEAVAMLDKNWRGLRPDQAKFYSLVISPSQGELALLGNDAEKLRAYTRQVMQAYAQNFNLKDNSKRTEQSLVWVALEHNERLTRGTDYPRQGSKKEGLQSHIHIMVSARDREQQVTLNPLGSSHCFNQVRFSATGNVLFDAMYKQAAPALGQNVDLAELLPVESSALAQQERYIRRRMKSCGPAATMAHLQYLPASTGGNSTATSRLASRARNPTPQDAARTQRLKGQVDRINVLLPAAHALDFTKVYAAGQARSFDQGFYGRLARIRREAAAGKLPLEPYGLLRTGRVIKPRRVRNVLPAGPRDRKAEIEAAGAFSLSETSFHTLTSFAHGRGQMISKVLAPTKALDVGRSIQREDRSVERD